MTNAEMKPVARERLLEAVLLKLDQTPASEGVDLRAPLAEAGVSQADFEAEFGDLDGCLSAAYGQLTRRLEVAVRAGCGLAAAAGDGAESWPRAVCAGLEALLSELASEPRLARALIRGFPSRGAAEQARYQAFVESFVPMLGEGRRFAAAEEELPGEVESLAVGAAEAIIFEEIEAGRAGVLPAMAPSILFSLLVPFLGPTRATEAMAETQRNG